LANGCLNGRQHAIGGVIQVIPPIPKYIWV
jgi:hypothetical protein